jgi:hypothetical protein
MSDITIPSIAQNLYSSQVQVTEPSDVEKFDPCGPTITSIDSSELTVIFPKMQDNTKKTVPLMGGSIVKISLNTEDDISKDERYISYYKNANEKILEVFNQKNIEILSKKSTSALRVLINRFLIDEISSGQNIGVVPSVYLSTTGSNFSDFDSKTDYFGLIRKNAIFSFYPIESIQTILNTISTNETSKKTIAEWSGLSGKKYKELYEVSKKQNPDELEIISLMLDLVPFFNLSQNEMLIDPIVPVLGGFFTIINKSIYLKMPDISGVDSAGYGDDYLSELNLLFQLIVNDSKKDIYSVKNLEIKKTPPIYSTLIEASSEQYDLKSPTDFSLTFFSTKKPTSVYLSPIINEEVKIPNNIRRLITASQSGNFIEYSSYPNPFVSILDNKILLDYHGSEETPADEDPFSKITTKGVDHPFSKVRYYGGDFKNNFSSSGLGKIRSILDLKYNKNLGINGPIGNYLIKVFTLSPYAVGIKPEDYFGAGFPFLEEIFQESSSVIGQTVTPYEFVGNLSRQDVILNNGKAFNDNRPSSSGKFGNNLKFFKKNFIANEIGLCENYRPRVFSSPESFVPSSWIKSLKVDSTEQEGIYSVSFSKSDFLKFYTEAASKMKFAMYTYDGENQILKVENGYLDIDIKPPEIIRITPDGTIQDGIVITCDETTLYIETKEANHIDSVKINNLEIKKTEGWQISPGIISIVIPCDLSIVRGEAEVIISASGVSSSPVKIYVANGFGSEDLITSTADLPTTISQPPFSADDVSSSNLKISGQNYEIPISYTDPRSLIQIRSTKGIFKEGRDIYLYLGFDTDINAKNFSQDIVEYNKDSKKLYIAKDFNYKLENSPLSDFYRKNKNKSYLYFPGNSNINKPLDLLTKNISKAYLVLSTRPPGNFSIEDNIGIIELGGDGKAPFVGPPTVIGMAAIYADDNKTPKNHLSNFQGSYSIITEEILRVEGIKYEGSNDLIESKDKFKKLIVLFSYKEIQKYKRKNFSLYINGKKINRIFSLDGARKASDLSDFSEKYPDSKKLYYFVVNNLPLEITEPAVVYVDIYDLDFKINISTKDKYKDFGVRVSKNIIVPPSDESTSIFTKEISSHQFLSLFGNYVAEGALTGFFTNIDQNNPILLDQFPGVSILSNLSNTISDIQDIASTENKISLFADTQSEITTIIPNVWITIPSNTEIKSSQYIESNEDYLIFIRLQVIDICKIALIGPRIIDLPDNLSLTPGQILTFKVQNILRNFIIELAGVEAKIVDVRKDTEQVDVYQVDVIVPEGIPVIIPAEKCGAKLYNGNQTLGDGNNQLGALTKYLDRTAAGLLGNVNKQFEQFKKTLQENPLKFVSLTLDAANQAKELITSFCNYSFKITADLSINLQGFSQLLVPVKVIFCIIDVICNIFNPFQLPQAIIRLFECLYDLILLLPQISIPVMFFNLLIHLLDFLECLIVKIFELITAINLIVAAIAEAIDGRINFREVLMLEEILLKYVISLEADLELLGPIVQILGLFLQLLSISFRFPCAISPSSGAAPCGIDGFELGSMVSGLISEPSGTAPDIVYNMDKKYLIPVAKPYVELASGTYDPPSYESAIEPVRGGLAFDGTSAVDGNLFDVSFFNPESMRKKENSFSSETDITSDTVITLRSSYTKRRKHLSSQQGVIFKFNERTWKSILPAFDRQIIDEYQSFDTPIVLLEKDGENLNIANSSSYGNFYSMIDGKSMMTEVNSSGTASVKPLTLEIVQNGVTIERTFETIPSMLIMDEGSNVYVISKDGIVFGTYKTTSGDTVVGIKEIKATIINQKSSVGESFSKEEESIEDPDDPTNQIVNNIFSFPQLYFVDTRVAAETIQSKCETASINQLPFDLTGDGGVKELDKMTLCINDFLDSVRLQTGAIKQSLSVGKVPEVISQEKVSAAYTKLVDCTNDSINNLCSIVINPLNTSLKLLNDSDLTPILPDPVLSTLEASGADGSGPALTGAREYAGGIGDAVTVVVGSNAFVELIPRDSYDNLITYNLSEKTKLQIISDTTENASINLNPIESNPQNYWSYSQESRTYLASITSSSPGIVKIKAVICNQAVQALTYSDLVDDNENNDTVNCVDGVSEAAANLNATPLGALSRIDRILTITFVPNETPVIIQSNVDQKDSIITEPQLFGTNMEN